MLKQPQYTPLPVQDQVVAIYSGVRGYLDKIDVADVGRFEESLLAEVRAKHADLLETIRDEGEISEQSEEKLKGIMEAFAKSFA